VVADENKSSLAHTLKRRYRHVQQHGHRWGNRVFNLIETVFFLQSEDSPGVQAGVNLQVVALGYLPGWSAKRE